jgi:hypothetical protein
MNHVVVLIPADGFPGGPVKTFGPYATAELAEQARRRVHMDAAMATGVHQQFPARAPRTFVTVLEPEA